MIEVLMDCSVWDRNGGLSPLVHVPYDLCERQDTAFRCNLIVPALPQVKTKRGQESE